MIIKAASLQSRVHSLADENIDTLAKDWGQNMDFRLDDVHPDSLETGSRIERLRKGSRWGFGSVPFDYHDDDDELCSGWIEKFAQDGKGPQDSAERTYRRERRPMQAAHRHDAQDIRPMLLAESYWRRRSP